MVRPNKLMLSVFITPWQNPTDCQWANKAAVRSDTLANKAV